MIEDRYSPEHQETNPRVPEARYAYYRRCQVFRRGGEQCKAPAEKGSHICHAHAGQLAMAVRRERERRAVLAEAVTQLRKRGKPNCEIADLFMDFDGIQITTAVMAQALIAGRIDCKTAGRLVVQLQTVSKLLRMLHRKGREGRKENRVVSQVLADDGRLDRPEEKQDNLPLIHTDNTDLKKPADQNLIAETRRRREQSRSQKNWAARCLTNEGEKRVALLVELRAVADRQGWAHAPPELLRAA